MIARPIRLTALLMLSSTLLSGCDRIDRMMGGTQASSAFKPKRGQVERACKSQLIASLVKDRIFLDAINRAPDNKEPLDNLRMAVMGRMEKVLFQGHDPAMRRTECSGTIHINIPPNAQRAFDKKDYLIADVTYAIQPSKDGPLVEVAGGDPIINRLVEAAVKKTVFLRVPMPRAPHIPDEQLPEFSDDDFGSLPYEPPVDDGFGNPDPQARRERPEDMVPPNIEGPPDDFEGPDRAEPPVDAGPEL